MAASEIYKVYLSGYFKHFNEKHLYLSVENKEISKLKSLMRKTSLNYPFENYGEENTVYICWKDNFTPETMKRYLLGGIRVLTRVRYFYFSDKKGVSCGYKLTLEKIEFLEQ